MSRPEEIAPPEIFYGVDEAFKYTTSSRMAQIQTAMSERAIELLNLPKDASGLVLLDIGCGTGLSGGVLNDHGHRWVGVDVSPAMLDVAVKRDVDGDLIHLDAGMGLPFRPGSFDGAISISAIQWLLNADKKEHNPYSRMKYFFRSLYACLKRGTRAVLQFYPSNEMQLKLLPRFATAAGFGGGLLCDFPHSAKARKYYLVLYCGPQPTIALPDLEAGGANPEDEAIVGHDGTMSAAGSAAARSLAASTRRTSRSVASTHRPKTVGKSDAPAQHMTTREWIRMKNTQRKMQGLQHRPESKYTGRKRAAKF